MVGPQKLLAASGIGKVVVSSSLPSMRHARRHGNAHCPAVLSCLPPSADSMPCVRPAIRDASAQRWCARAPRCSRCIRANGGTYAGRGNGDYRSELTSALQAITTYLTHFAFLPHRALVRLDGQYGDAAVIAQIILAGVYLITRGRGYQLLEHPQIQAVLALPATARVTRRNTGERVELFEGGWLALGEGLPSVRVIVARHRAPAPDKPVRVGKLIGEWVYELFLTTLEAEWFLVEDVVDLYHGRGAFEAVLAQEDVEEDPDRWCSYTECGQELWQIACQWVWNLRLSLGHAMQGTERREIEWAPPKERPPVV